VNPVIVISARDNVATALEALEPGRLVGDGGTPIAVREAIPRGHKIAIAAIAAGAAIVKYGSSIGTATTDIPQGAHVHTHNVSSGRGRGDLVKPAARSDGRIAEPDEGLTP
jgi:altronate dehydratase